MKIRSLCRVSVIVCVVLAMFAGSFALANSGSSVPGNQAIIYTEEDSAINAYAYLQAAEGMVGFNDKVEKSYTIDSENNAITFNFDINCYIGNAFIPDNFADYIRSRVSVFVPNNEKIKKIKIAEGNDWSVVFPDENSNVEVTPDDFFENGCRVEAQRFTNASHKYEYTQTYTFLNQEGTPVEGETPVTVTVAISYPYAPTAVFFDSITPQQGGVGINGKVLYPNENTQSAFTTEIMGPEGAVSYALSTAPDTLVSLVDRKVKLTDSCGENNNYTILWYDSANSLLKVETLDVIFYTGANAFEPVPVEWLTSETFYGLEGVSGVTVNVPTTDGFISGPIEFKCDVDAENWQKAFTQSVSTEEVRWPFGIVVPNNAIAVQAMGTSYGEGYGDDPTKAMIYLNSEPYYNVLNEYDCQLDQFTELATVTYDNSNALITPQTVRRSYVFKWLDDKGVEHFHRVWVEVNHADDAVDKTVEIPSVVPTAARVIMNSKGISGISAKYDDGTVVYSVEQEQSSGNIVTTGIYCPKGIDVTQLRVIPQRGETLTLNVDEKKPAEFSISADADDRREGTFRLEWLDADNNVKKNEVIAIQVLPQWKGSWVDESWAPANQQTMSDINIGSYLSYKDGILTFSVDPNKTDGLNPEELCTEREYCYIIVPDGATHFKYHVQHSPLYGDFARSTATVLDGVEYIAVDNANGIDLPLRKITVDGKACLAVNFGAVFKKTNMADNNLTVYTVDDSLAGYADMLHIQWYEYDDAAQTYSLIQRNDKTGEYICMVKEPYMLTAETELEFDKDASVSPKPGEAYAIVLECDDDTQLKDMKFRCEVPLQKNTHGNHRYVYQKLDLINGDGNVVELPPNTTIKVVLPYPEGLSKDNTKLEYFDVWHYEDESLSKHESMRQKGVLALEDIGVTFITDSFSPFLLRYEPSEASGPYGSSGGSGISVTYNGGNSFSTSKSTVPTSVEIDGVPVSFTGNGSSFTVSGIPAGAKWITVRWNSTSVTTNFTPDANAGFANVAIPKTGDASILMPVLTLIGAAAIRRRRHTK